VSEPFQVDPSRSAELVGKTVLVGVTYLDAQENVIEQRQWHGRIRSIGKLIEVQVHESNEIRTLPPMLQIAEPGEYHLASTGEVVSHPHFVTTWEVFAGDGPPPGMSPDEATAIQSKASS
jgi:hypothetical protein